MTNETIVKDKRVKFAVQNGQYTRAISLFLQIQNPEMPLADIASLPAETLRNAQIAIDNAFLEKWIREEARAKEMR
jgi:hypothetical protein